MAEMFCKGCGALIQNKDDKLPGYISDELLNSRRGVLELGITLKCIHIRFLILII